MSRVDFAQFEKLCIERGLSTRVWSKGEFEAANAPKEKKHDDTPLDLSVIAHGNEVLFDKMCRADGVDPKTTKVSPALRRLIVAQNEQRAQLDSESES